MSSLKSRINSGGVFVSAAGMSLLDSLWQELIKEWCDPDVEILQDGDVEFKPADYDAGYCVGIAYGIAKIQYPYMSADERIELVLDEARKRVSDGNQNHTGS